MLFSKISALAVAGLAFVDGTVAQNKFPLTGVRTGWNGAYRPPRKDIRDLAKDPQAYSLFIQALNALQAVPESNLTSYFNIGGIHGRPWRSWDGYEFVPGATPLGYCPHGNIQFGLWHRAYLLLIEQLIAAKAQEIARPLSQQWRRSADALRLPYLDWAAAPYGWPSELLSAVNVTITTPSGQRTVRNPLFRYEFKGQPYPESVFPQDFYGSANATFRSSDSSIRLNFEEEGSIFARQVWNVFAQQTSFNNMTTYQFNGNNFEGVHGAPHIMVGGHMAPVDYTGFDPFFWLHHATVDRQIALWQAINPNAWIEPATTPGGTWSIVPGSLLTETTTLSPFTQGDRTSPHTSNSVRNIAALGYSYADIPSHILTGAALSANVTARVNQIYNPNGTLGRRSSFKPRRNAGVMERQEGLKEWSISVSVPNKAIGGLFSIRFSLNGVHIGLLSIISVPTKADIDAGVNPVTKAEFSLSPGLEGVEDVEASIQAGLSWTVTKLDGTVVPLDQVEGLEVVVAEQSVVPAEEESSFPDFGDKIVHSDLST